MPDSAGSEFSEKIGDHGFSFSKERDYDDVTEAEFQTVLEDDIDTFFFLVGFPKCATSTISSAIAAQPSATLPEMKEPFFFSSDEYEHGMGFYWEKYFQNWNGELIVGDAATSHSYIPFVPSRIAEQIPNAKIIFALRHPVDRAYSNWWMYRSSGLEDLAFEEAVEWELTELENDLLPLHAEDDDFWYWYRRRQVTNDIHLRRRTVRTYLMRSYYVDHIKRFQQYFDDDQIHYVFQGELRNDRERVLNEVFDFLDIPVNRDVPEEDHHVSGKKSDHRVRIRQKVEPYRDAIPQPVWNGARTAVDTVAEAVSETGMDDNTRDRLLDHFRPKNAELEELLGKDLPHWNE